LRLWKNFTYLYVRIFFPSHLHLVSSHVETPACLNKGGTDGRRLAVVLEREEGRRRGTPRVCSGIGVRWRKIVTH